jgi:hypothetical protein
MQRPLFSRVSRTLKLATNVIYTAESWAAQLPSSCLYPKDGLKYLFFLFLPSTPLLQFLCSMMEQVAEPDMWKPRRSGLEPKTLVSHLHCCCHWQAFHFCAMWPGLAWKLLSFCPRLCSDVLTCRCCFFYELIPVMSTLQFSLKPQSPVHRAEHVKTQGVAAIYTPRREASEETYQHHGPQHCERINSGLNHICHTC